MDWGYRTGMCTLLYVEWRVNWGLLYSRGNSPQYPVINYMGKELKKRKKKKQTSPHVVNKHEKARKKKIP